ncbi:MAG: KH domain-containing protein [Patescibacteria group bacterium]
MAQEQDAKFVEGIVKEIVANPGDVKVDRTVDERGVLLTLTVNPSDIGYVIGKQGQTARAIRTLTKIIGAKNNARVNLKIFEPEGNLRRPRREDSREGGFKQEERVDTDVVGDLEI